MKTTLEDIGVAIAFLEFQKRWLEKNAPAATKLTHGCGGTTGFAAYCYDWNRDEILSEMAHLFGADGWMANVDCDKINWSKEVDGITIEINNAKRMPKESTSYPVPPTDFPLQLENSNE